MYERQYSIMTQHHVFRAITSVASFVNENLRLIVSYHGFVCELNFSRFGLNTALVHNSVFMGGACQMAST